MEKMQSKNDSRKDISTEHNKQQQIMLLFVCFGFLCVVEIELVKCVDMLNTCQ